MPITPSQGTGNTGTPPIVAPTITGSGTAGQSENQVYMFMAGWLLLLVVLVFVNKTRLGHVIIYYSLMLIILFILVTEYQRITPFLTSLATPSQLG